MDGYCKELNININYVLQFSEKKITNIGRIEKLPKFYQEVLCAVNERKANPVKMSSDETMQQPIWNNCNFQYGGNTLIFKNWVTCRVLHVKNLFSKNGNF